MTETATLHRPLARLRQFAEQRQQPVERCELCSVPLAALHTHLIEPESRRLVCSCEACATLFPNQEGTKYRRIPRDVRRLADFQLTDAQWDRLLIPINVAFFFVSSMAERMVALYPSPAGATESLLELDAWNEIADANPVLENMQPDVEALLVNRLPQKGAGPICEQHSEGRSDTRNTTPVSTGEHYLAPIDKCYELVGLIRANWRGLSGGTEVWRHIGTYFDKLQGAAR